MKYWRGYLVAAILGFFSWALLEFAKNHIVLVDMFYPYMTRMIQGTLAQWSGGTDQLLWQLLLVLFPLLTPYQLLLLQFFLSHSLQMLLPAHPILFQLENTASDHKLLQADF